jgi:hypothetical protein
MDQEEENEVMRTRLMMNGFQTEDPNNNQSSALINQPGSASLRGNSNAPSPNIGNINWNKLNNLAGSYSNLNLASDLTDDLLKAQYQ